MKSIEYNDVLTMPDVIGANLKALRTHCELSLGDVAEISGLSKPFLSLVETGKRTIKPMVLRKILLQCGYSLGFFISEVQQSVDEIKGFRNTVVNNRQSSLLLDGSRENGKHQVSMFRILNSVTHEQLLQIYIPPEAALHSEFITVNSRIRGIVTQGTILIDFKNDEHIAKEGDEFCYDGSIRHILRNYTHNPTAFYLWVENGGF